MANLNEAIGWPRTDGQLNLFKNKSVRANGAIHQMGDKIAREIEQALNLPNGWMDTPPTYTEMRGEQDPISKAIMVMENMPEAERYKAVRLLDALSEQPTTAKTGTLG
jgi:hypothetical protein